MPYFTETPRIVVEGDKYLPEHSSYTPSKGDDIITDITSHQYGASDLPQQLGIPQVGLSFGASFFTQVFDFSR